VRIALALRIRVMPICGVPCRVTAQTVTAKPDQLLQNLTAELVSMRPSVV